MNHDIDVDVESGEGAERLVLLDANLLLLLLGEVEDLIIGLYSAWFDGRMNGTD